MHGYPDSCRKCLVKKKCGYKYREHNRIPRGKDCLFNKKEEKEMTTYEAAETNTKKVENIEKCFGDLVLGREPIILEDISKKDMNIKLSSHMSFAEIEEFAFIMYTVLNNIKKEIQK